MFECLESSVACFERNTRSSFLSKRIFENLVCKRGHIYIRIYLIYLFFLIYILPILKLFLESLGQLYPNWLHWLVLVTICLGGRFRINCSSAFLKILKLPEWNEGNFKIFKNHEDDLSQKSPEPNTWLLVNHTKPKNTLYWK